MVLMPPLVAAGAPDFPQISSVLLRTACPASARTVRPAITGRVICWIASSIRSRSAHPMRAAMLLPVGSVVGEARAMTCQRLRQYCSARRIVDVMVGSGGQGRCRGSVALARQAEESANGRPTAPHPETSWW